MTAEENKEHVLSYMAYMALDTRTASGVWKRKLTLKTQASWKVSIGTLTCELAVGL